METVTTLQLSEDGLLSRQSVQISPPAVDEVVVDVSATILCHDDASRSRTGTPGRHFVGTVSECGAATQWQVGDRVVSAPPGSCGRCRQCVRGADAYCSTFAESYATRIPGVTIDGGLAERVRVPAQLLVPVGDIDPTAAVLASALGCLAMNAIKETAHAITIGDPVVIIGSNALASYTAAAVDAASAATVVQIANPENPADEATAKLDLTNGIPVVLVMERTQPGCDLAARLATAGGEIVVVNTGSGSVHVAPMPDMRYEVGVRVLAAGGRSDLIDALQLAEALAGHVTTRTVPFGTLDRTSVSTSELTTTTLVVTL